MFFLVLVILLAWNNLPSDAGVPIKAVESIATFAAAVITC